MTNVAVTYGRSLVSLALGLFASRWLLLSLGVDDFGLASLVGSLMAFANFLGDLLRASVARNFAYVLGERGEQGVETWLAAAIGSHVGFAFLFVVLCWPLGEWAVRCVVTVSPERLPACLILLRLSVLTLFVNTAGIPFGALFTARQRFGLLALFGIGQSAWMFVCAWWLLGYAGDRLVAYASYTALGVLALHGVQAVWALHDCRVRWQGVLRPSVEAVRGLVSFAGWNAFGIGGYLFGVHGSAFVTNHVFGPAGNAAYGVSQQVQYHTEGLANALIGAFAPELTTRRGAGDIEGMRQLADKTGFLGGLLLAFFAVPLVAEMPTVLGLWLVAPPPGAGEVCAVMLGASVLNKLTMGHQLAISADGRIARWQIVTGALQSLALPVSVLVAAASHDMRSAAFAYLVSVGGCALANIGFGRRIAGRAVLRWVRTALLPLALLVLCAWGATLLSRFWLPAGVVRVIVTSACTSLVFAVGVFVWKYRI